MSAGHGFVNCSDERKNAPTPDRKSTRLNSSHSQISYAVFCLKKKKKIVRLTGDLKFKQIPRNCNSTNKKVSPLSKRIVVQSTSRLRLEPTDNLRTTRSVLNLD